MNNQKACCVVILLVFIVLLIIYFLSNNILDKYCSSCDDVRENMYVANCSSCNDVQENMDISYCSSCNDVRENMDVAQSIQNIVINPEIPEELYCSRLDSTPSTIGLSKTCYDSNGQWRATERINAGRPQYKYAQWLKEQPMLHSDKNLPGADI